MCVVLFGSNSPKMSVLFRMSSDKKCVLFGSVPLKISIFFDMNSGKRFVVLFCIYSQIVSEVFHMNSKVITLLFSKSCLVFELA